ncbi:MAG: rhodanese-like domain-containing protein [Chitinophagaceae bacterium]
MVKSIFSLFLCFLAFTFIVAAQNNYKEISLPQLMQKVQQGSKGYIILDVRTPGEYMDTASGGRRTGIGRIKNAINISLQDLLQKPGTLQQLEKNKQEDIYVICSHSYRSRRISNLLLENGFSSVNNVQGGMTEWYRNYDELKPYAADLYENNIAYHNMAPSQLFQKLMAKQPVELIGFSNPPRFYFDSLIAPLYSYFPGFKNANYYRLADTAQILEKVKPSKDKAIVFFNTIGGGASETAEWLAKKGFKNVYNLVGNLTGFYEYLANYQSPGERDKYLIAKSRIQFYTPLSFCKEQPKNVQWVDLRHDTTFNQITHGTKLDYKTLEGAVNFPFYKTPDDFSRQFPDKKKFYMILPEQGYKGVELAGALLSKGYNIGWLIGGLERWEWYTNNIQAFVCKDQLVK